MTTYTKIPDIIANRQDLSWNEKAVYARIFRYAKYMHDWTYVTYRTLGESLGLPERSVMRAARFLKEKGLIEVRKSTRGNHIKCLDMNQALTSKPAVCTDMVPQEVAIQQEAELAVSKLNAAIQQKAVATTTSCIAISETQERHKIDNTTSSNRERDWKGERETRKNPNIARWVSMIDEL